MSESNIPESRSYRHVKCDGITTVSDQSFEVLSNPMSSVTRTWCTDCDAFAPLEEFEWVDTQENIVAYYERHSTKATALEDFLVSKKCMVILAAIGFVLGAVGGFFLFRDEAVWMLAVFFPFCGGLGAFGGLAVYISVLCGPITRRVCGVKDTRSLK